MEHLNLNDRVWVKLTPEGEAAWANYWLPVAKMLGLAPGEIPKACRHEDDKGNTSFQLWELMQVFGREMFMGNSRHMFEGNNIWFGE